MKHQAATKTKVPISKIVEFVQELNQEGKLYFLVDVARHFKISRRTLENYRSQSPELRATLEEARENLSDFVEGRLLHLIRIGNVSAIIFYAKTQMRNRGYVERAPVQDSGELSEWLDQIKTAQTTFGELG
ncbi:MAG: hypothetical protein ACRCYY_00335 [Trueperaceae bacterium]